MHFKILIFSNGKISITQLDAFFFFLAFFGFVPLIATLLAGAINTYEHTVGPTLAGMKMKGKITDVERQILEKHVGYYRNMTPEMKYEFEKRLRYFLSDKSFVPRQMEGITSEMYVMVAAAAVQLTFGFMPLRFPHFPTILIYPGQYLSKVTGKKHKGEVNTRGIIVFSWEDFINGYKTPEDGYNVGLHEMAHALKVEDFTPNDESGFISESALARWHKLSTEELNRMRGGYKSFLRHYASANSEEFFAVSVEYFFEKSQEFKQNLPHLYDAMARLLNQDPLNPGYRYIRNAA